MECDEPCDGMCSNLPDECIHANYEEMNELQIFESKTLATIEAIRDVTNQKKLLEVQDKNMRAQLEKIMEECGIKSFENDMIKITYINQTERKTIDSDKLRKELPDVAEKYTKVSKVKATTKITVK